MKKCSILSRAVVAALFVSTAFAQFNYPVNYYRVQFLKAKPGKLSEYEAFVKKNVPSISQASIKEGKLVSWGLTSVVTPTGTSVNHDLIGIYGYKNWEQLEPAGAPSDAVKAAMKALGFASPEDYNAKRDPLRDVARTEIWRLAAGTAYNPANSPKPGEYVVIGYLKADKVNEYIESWKKYSVPLQEERIKAGTLKSYTMWTVPGSGSGSQYNVVSLSRFATFKDAGGAAPGAVDPVAERIHAGKDWQQMRRDMQALRTLVRSEITKIEARVP